MHALDREENEGSEDHRGKITKGRRYTGGDDWMKKAAGELGLELTIRPRGRPRKY